MYLIGTEDGPSAPEASVGFTAFNMNEELEEGHFDRDGHYLWNKEKQIRDNWLDNIDWVRVSKMYTYIMCYKKTSIYGELNLFVFKKHSSFFIL